jgi:subtilisin family serine protease
MSMSRAIVILSCSTLALLAGAAAAQERLADPQGQLQAFGAVRVIARVKPVNQLPAGLDRSMSLTDIATLSVPQDQVVDARQLTPSLVSVTVRAEGYDALNASQNLSGVYVDRLAESFLAESVPMIGAPVVWPEQQGQGMAVAVLDTGVDRSHPGLAGRVIHEACFSSTLSEFGSSTLCPNGENEQKTPGAATPCPAEVRGCDHGTHVAGIAAGAIVASEPRHDTGVAPAASIIAMQVFSLFRNPDICGTSSACVRSWTSDQIRALQHVADLARQGTFTIAAANMSLGSGRHLQPCDDDVMKVDIDALRGLGIATVIAAGNSAFSDAIAEPACISSAVSVGASNDADGIATRFSNRASFMSLLAPGDTIVAAVPGGFGEKNGTSMAAPHVAGTWALLKGLKPAASVDQILAALRNSGVTITDPVTGENYPRIAVDAAATALGVAVPVAVAATGATRSAAAIAPAAGPLAESTAQRVIVVPPPGAATPADVLAPISSEVLQGRSITLQALPGVQPRYSLSAPREAIEQLERAGMRVQQETLAEPQ